MKRRKIITGLFMTVCFAALTAFSIMADEEWIPVTAKLLGSEAVEQLYIWNENDDIETQVRGMVHNLFMDEEDVQIKLMATDYTLVMTGVKLPQDVMEDGSALIGVYYGEYGPDTAEKISLFDSHMVQTKYLGNNQTAVFISPDELLDDEEAFHKNIEKLYCKYIQAIIDNG